MGNNVWFKEAVVYVLPIKAFKDSNSDGYGDINGLISKLDYFKDLGINCILLLPMYQSPERDGGYDVENYYAINSYLGTMEDFQELLYQAHQKNIKVIIEMVLNHTSNTHQWFLEAAKGPDNPYHDYYIWSETTEKFKEAKVLYREHKQANWTYHKGCNKYYFHRYFSYEPDLNYNNPKVTAEIKEILKFWLDLGVDGFFFDSIAYLFKREGTNCENLPETNGFIKEIRSMIDENYESKILMGTINKIIGDRIVYSGKDYKLHALSSLTAMASVFIDMQKETWESSSKFTDNIPTMLIDYIDNQMDAHKEVHLWFSFCGAHNIFRWDMLEDGEREFLFPEYGKKDIQQEDNIIKSRIAPHFDNNKDRVALFYAQIIGSFDIPVIYYGDEIGIGDNNYSKNILYTPMQWDNSVNAGFSDCIPSKMYAPVITDNEYHYSTVNVEVQKNKPNSTFNFLKKLLACRNKYKVFKGGEYLRLPLTKKEVRTFMRSCEDEVILIVANLSGKFQDIDIDLSDYSGMYMLDIYNEVVFPQISELPYRIALAPYGFYYFKFFDVEWMDDE